MQDIEACTQKGNCSLVILRSQVQQYINHIKSLTKTRDSVALHLEQENKTVHATLDDIHQQQGAFLSVLSSIRLALHHSSHLNWFLQKHRGGRSPRCYFRKVWWILFPSAWVNRWLTSSQTEPPCWRKYNIRRMWRPLRILMSIRRIVEGKWSK